MTRSRDSFVRLAEARTKRTLKDIRLIGNLSNRSNYTYSEEDIRKIFGALERELKNTKQRFIDQLDSVRERDFTLQ